MSFYYNKSEIILFETKDKEVTLSVPMDGDIVWLTQEQMSSLFDTSRSSIAYHIGNIFKEGELEKNTSVEIFDRSTNYKDVGALTGGIYTTWKYVDSDFKEFVNNTICQGSYVDADIDVDDETHIVTLSTCSYDSDVRFTVSAVRVDEHEWNQ